MKKFKSMVAYAATFVLGLISVSSCSEQNNRITEELGVKVIPQVENNEEVSTGKVFLTVSGQTSNILDITIAHQQRVIERADDLLGVKPGMTASTPPTETASGVNVTGTRKWTYDDTQVTTATWKTLIPDENPLGISMKVQSITPADYEMVLVGDKYYALPTVYHVVMSVSIAGEAENVEFDMVPCYYHKGADAQLIWTVTPQVANTGTTSIGTVNLSVNGQDVASLLRVSIAHQYGELTRSAEVFGQKPNATNTPALASGMQWLYDDTQVTTANWQISDYQNDDLNLTASVESITPVDYQMSATDDSHYLLPTVYRVVAKVTANDKSENVEFDMVPTYMHTKAAPAVVTYRGEIVNVTSSDKRLNGTCRIIGSDGFTDEIVVPLAIYGLPEGIDPLYVKDMTTYGHKAESTTTAGKVNTKGKWSYSQPQIATEIETLFKTVTGGLVGPYNRVIYKVTEVKYTLPNDEEATFTVSGRTLVEDDRYVTDPQCHDHFCAEENHQAKYENTLVQAVEHRIAVTINVGGQTTPVALPGLEKVDNEQILAKGEARTNIYSTGD